MDSHPVMARLVSRSLKKNFPLNVHLDVTYRCNERCVHCYLEHDDHGEMTMPEIQRVLEELAAAGALFLTFSGGEVFLRKDFFELVEHARRLRFDVSLKTNAVLLNEERVLRLKSLGVRRVQISVYSADSDVHDAITQVPGSFAKTLAAIELLKKHGLLVKLSCPLMKQNLSAFRGVQALAESLGVPYIMDHTITPMINGDRRVTDFRLAGADLLPVFSDSRLNPRAAAGQAPERMSTKTSGATAAAYDNLPCSAGHNSCYISPYGDVMPCVQMAVPAGNLRRSSFAEVWYGSAAMGRVRAVRESMVEICSDCAIRSYCQRCPGLAQMEDGNLMGPSSRACELAELNARIAGVENPVSALHALQQSGLVPLNKTAGAGQGLVGIAPLRAS